jgi:type VI secretion system secreted protein VgrG
MAPLLFTPSAEQRAQAAASGYANRFEAIRAAIPWRPAATAQPAPRVHPGVLTATVVGPRGETSASGAEQIHMDALGRIRIQFDFQSIQPRTQTQTQTQTQTSNTSTWVRVLQRWAGAGMGMQFIPRIGQQVLVDFVGGDIERPLVVGSLYDGQGEAGLAPTPGGQAAEEGTNDNASDNNSAFKQSTDHSPSAQANLTGGHSPAWHGQAGQPLDAGGQANAAALSGYKSAEFGAEQGSRYNQLVFDDTNNQLRLQLATTQHATQLNLGHLIHQADNHRGSLRGLGFELRSDAYGAVRAGQGVLISSYGTQPSEPAGDNTAGMALQSQLTQLSQTLSKAAQTHQTTQLASSLGSFKAATSAVNDQLAPAKAVHAVMKGMVDGASLDQAQGDAAAKNTSTGDTKLPHTTDPTVLITARAGLAVVAGQDIQVSAAELIHLASGGDTHVGSGGAARIHSGQSIGILAGAVAPGDQAQGKGITLIAGKGDVEVQAQADRLQVAAKMDVSIQSKSAHIDWAAAKKITLATAGGASVTIEGGNITVEGLGKILIKAGKRSFVGPETYAQGKNAMPGPSTFNDAYLLRNPATGEALANQVVEITRGDGTMVKVTTDSQGRTPLQKSDFFEVLKIRVL